MALDFKALVSITMDGADCWGCKDLAEVDLCHAASHFVAQWCLRCVQKAEELTDEEYQHCVRTVLGTASSVKLSDGRS